MSDQNIECLNFKRFDSSGCLFGFADFYIPKTGMEIFGCSVFQKEGRRWINFPNREFTDDAGEKKYIPYIRFRNKDLNNLFISAALKALDHWILHNHEEQVEAVKEEDLPF